KERIQTESKAYLAARPCPDDEIRGRQGAQPVVTAWRSESGTGRWNSRAVTYRSTMRRDPLTPSSVNRNATFRRCAARISPLFGSSQSCRLNGPIAFLRVL